MTQKNFRGLAGLALGVAMVVTASVAATAADDPADTQGPDQRLVLVSPLLCGTSDYWQSICDGWTKAGEALGPGYTVEIEHMPFGDLAQFLSLVSTVVGTNPDGIAVIPYGQDAMVPVLTEADEAGIKVVILDNDVPGFANRISFIATDNKLAGATAAEWLLSQPLSSKQIAGLTQPPGQAQSVDDRLAGFKEVVESAGYEMVVEVPTAGCDAAEGRSATENILQGYPDVTAIFSLCDLGGIGAAQALVAADRTDIFALGVDAQPTAVRLILEDQGYDASAAQFPLKMGRIAVETLRDALAGKTVPGWIDTGTQVITAENAAAYLEDADAYSPPVVAAE
jgi:ABC-type sugar transport system substrate-binding protein